MNWNWTGNPTRYAVLVAAIITFVGCGKVVDPGDGTHQCQVAYNTSWTPVPLLTLIHSDPSTCPVDKAPGDGNIVGGQVIEVNAPSGSPGNAFSMTAAVYDNYTPSTFTGSGLLNYDLGYFYRAGQGPSSTWQALAFTYYTVDNNPDWLHYYVACSSCSGPLAYVEIQYAGQPE